MGMHVCIFSYAVCVLSSTPSPVRGYVKQLELVCLPGHAREDSSRGKSVAALCVEGLVTVVGLACHLGERRRGAMLLGVVASSEGPGQEVDSVALHLVRKFQVCAWRGLGGWECGGVCACVANVHPNLAHGVYGDPATVTGNFSSY